MPEQSQSPAQERDVILLRMLDTSPYKEARMPLSNGPSGETFYDLNQKLMRYQGLPSTGELVSIFSLCEVIDRLAASQINSVRIEQAGELLESELHEKIQHYLDNKSD